MDRIYIEFWYLSNIKWNNHIIIIIIIIIIIKLMLINYTIYLCWKYKEIPVGSVHTNVVSNRLNFYSQYPFTHNVEIASWLVLSWWNPLKHD